MDWLKDGDQCSAYFFKSIAIRRMRARIFSLEDANGNELRDKNLIRDELVRFYTNLLGISARASEDGLPDFQHFVTKKLTNDEASHMIRPVELEEIKQVFFSIPDYKAPGLDGFTAVCSGNKIWLWQDPWHDKGILDIEFPRGSSLLGLPKDAKLSAVIENGLWCWPRPQSSITVALLASPPVIHDHDEDFITWKLTSSVLNGFGQGTFTQEGFTKTVV
ncbi:hypothetical protein BUALT_Bualt04G0057900 [Buddleja alternifolia]|uniref:Uncharacterized protein n=1 Tax=Buddleja alternifolia TaxID=168488 RepID=A0AAV6XNL8_9LAMI|nr:hypothetical protein BUALT_Bualt04G0057900 [Buddleja alternifolia]